MSSSVTLPYVARTHTSSVFPYVLVAAGTFKGFRVVYERPAMPELGPLGVGVWDGTYHEDRFDGARAQFTPADDIPLQSFLSRLKKSMLNYGASPEAVRLVGECSPFTKKELDIMAEKLKAKAATADKAGLKEAAKTAPVAKGKGKAAPAAAVEDTPAEAATAKAPKGNAAALEKARSASSDALNKKKITINTKENPYREGTKAAATFNVMKRSKTVAAFKEAVAGSTDYDPAYLRYAERDGHITLS